MITGLRRNICQSKRSRSGSVLLFNGSDGPDAGAASGKRWPASPKGSEDGFLHNQLDPSHLVTDEKCLFDWVFAPKAARLSAVLYITKSRPLLASVGKNQQTNGIIDEKGLIDFCRTPRYRNEIIDFLAIPSGQYALRRYLDPLVRAGAIHLTIPDKPRSPSQQFFSIEND